ncbi:MAG TPA: VCBS repeat-containing protein [Thermoanaerobaculia bacterium]|nr:VCBS repeat-containing protein [Thermoanaerobaculia bacterium]
MKKLVVLCVVLMCSSVAFADVQLRASRIDSALAQATWGDFNGDGLDDVLRNNMLQWNVGGRFSAPMTLAQFDEHAAFAEDAIDVNGDRHADIIRYATDGALSLYLGDGAGGFTEHAFPNQYGSLVKVADFTNDGIPDALIVNTGKLWILRNDGAANFTLHQELNWPERELFPEVGIGDLNGDATADFAVASETRLYVFYGNADGIFGEPRVRFTRRPIGLINIGDVTGDARNDLSGLHTFNGKEGPVVLMGDGAGRFPGVSRHHVQTDFSNDTLVIGDFIPGGAKEIAYSDPLGTVHLLTALNGGIRDVGSVTIDADIRPWTDNIGPRLAVRHFRNASQDDLIVQAYSLDVRANPPSRVWLVDVQGNVSPIATASTRSRSRAVAGFADRLAGDYRVDILESSCPITLSAVKFEQEGMFIDVQLNEQIRGAEAIYMDGQLWVRLTVMSNGTVRELNGMLKPVLTGGFAGKLFEDGATPCGGWQWHNVVLSVER